MDSNWILMKEESGLSRPDWLRKNLESGSCVGFDPYLMPVSDYNTLRSALSGSGIRLVGVEDNLVDIVWGSERPSRPDNPIVHLDMEFSGEPWESKIQRTREAMRNKDCDLLVLSALDEVAWLLNLRGSDIPNNPVFFSYSAVTESKVYLFVNDAQVDQKIKQWPNLEIRPYDGIKGFLEAAKSVYKRAWFSNQASQGLAGLVSSFGEDKPLSTLFEVTPVCLMKAIKNPVELKGFEQCHIRDGAALCAYFAWLEKNVSQGNVTEISGAEKLLQFRQDMANFVQVSFDTISAVGPNSSVIHYHPSPETDRRITTEEMYLLDSGGQYKDGTTDVTRTVHFGNPSQFEKECFTRVLKGQIRLATQKFPNKTIGSRLDTIARLALWDVGLDYKHGTGHGVGSYLNVHEGPMGISWRPYPDDPGLQKGMVLSDEPGYYLDQKFGIRIENLVKVVDAPIENFLTFETLTLVPIQTKMILPELLTKDELDYLNDYHELCREKVGTLLRELGHSDALNYLVRETEPLG